MKNDDIKNKLNVLENKLNLLVARSVAEMPCPYTLHKFFDIWLSSCKPPTLSKKWLSVLRCNIARMKSLTCDKPLNEYTAAELMKAVFAVPMSYTRSNCYNLLKAVFGYAARLGYVFSNPMDKTERVKHTRDNGRALTLDEQRQFLNAIEADILKPLYLFYLLSGCRCSEALNLKWGDIDFNACQIHINGTKTARANRYVPLFPQIRAVLADLPRSGVFIFPYTYDGVKSHFQRLKRRFGFSFRLHDLRHTFATRCIESGISLLTVSKWLGHCNISITANIYAHILTDFERQEVERFDPKF